MFKNFWWSLKIIKELVNQLRASSIIVKISSEFHDKSENKFRSSIYYWSLKISSKSLDEVEKKIIIS